METNVDGTGVKMEGDNLAEWPKRIMGNRKEQKGEFKRFRGLTCYTSIIGNLMKLDDY